jgi:hypothetical protein
VAEERPGAIPAFWAEAMKVTLTCDGNAVIAVIRRSLAEGIAEPGETAAEVLRARGRNRAREIASAGTGSFVLGQSASSERPAARALERACGMRNGVDGQPAPSIPPASKSLSRCADASRTWKRRACRANNGDLL